MGTPPGGRAPPPRLGRVISRIDLRGRHLSRRELTRALPRPELDVAGAAEQVAPILEDVRARGAAALRDLGERFDGVRPTHLRVPVEALAAALEGLDPLVRSAVALVSNPELLVLDEPTVAMDVEGRHAFWRTMREFATRGKTVLFATHYLEEADAYADRAVLMAHGKVVADGPTNEIKAMVGTRTIRATLPGADRALLAALPGYS